MPSTGFDRLEIWARRSSMLRLTEGILIEMSNVARQLLGYQSAIWSTMTPALKTAMAIPIATQRPVGSTPSVGSLRSPCCIVLCANTPNSTSVSIAAAGPGRSVLSPQQGPAVAKESA